MWSIYKMSMPRSRSAQRMKTDPSVRDSDERICGMTKFTEKNAKSLLMKGAMTWVDGKSVQKCILRQSLSCLEL